MQAKFVSNFAQHQRAHGQLTVREKVFLPLHDGGADAQNCVKPLLDVFYKPARFLQPLLQCLATHALVLSYCVGINVLHF